MSEAATDHSDLSALRKVIDLAIARSPEKPDGFLGEDIAQAVGDHLAALIADRAAQAEAKALREFAAELDAKADRLTDWMAKGTLRTAAEWALERAAAAARADREEAPDAR